MYILDEAKLIVEGGRQVNYGNPEYNFQKIADYWNVYLKHKIQFLKKAGKKRARVLIEPSDVARLMILLKEARLDNNPDHYDSRLDIVGYMHCYDVIRREKK